MKLTIKKIVYQEEEREVQLPFYYTNDISTDEGHNVTYAMVTELEVVEIQESYSYDNTQRREYKIRTYAFYSFDCPDWYFDKEHKSGQVVFEAAVVRMNAYIKQHNIDN